MGDGADARLLVAVSAARVGLLRELRARAGLDGDEVVVVVLGDLVDALDLVPGGDEEALEAPTDVVVLGEREVQLRRAADATALAEEHGVVVRASAATLDRLVHATPIDLRADQIREFSALGNMEAGPDTWYVPKAEVDYPLWNRLIGVTNPERLDRANTPP